jgi:hypothetical protein
MLMFRVYKYFVLFYEREFQILYTLNVSFELPYNSPFIYAGLSRNLTPAYKNNLLYLEMKYFGTYLHLRGIKSANSLGHCIGRTFLV